MTAARLALILTIILAVVAEGNYLASTPFTVHHLPYVPTHVPSVGRVRYCQQVADQQLYDLPIFAKCLHLKGAPR